MAGPAVLIGGARQLLTLRGAVRARRGPELLDLGIITEGAVLAVGGRIRAIGTWRQIANLSEARGATEIDATGRVVMPAFVDLETSLVHAKPSPRAFERLFENHDNPEPERVHQVLAEGASALSEMSSKILRQRLVRTAQAMIRHGTGTAESRAGYHLEESAATKVLRLQSAPDSAPLELVSSLLLDPPENQDLSFWATWVIEDLLPSVRRDGLATFVDFELREDVPLPIASRLCEIARNMNFGVKVHSDHFSTVNAVGLATRVGATSAGQLRGLTPFDIQLLAGSRTIAVLKPAAALETGADGTPPGRALIDGGAAPALASAFHAELSPGYNMQLMLLLACRLYRFRPQEAISAATYNNACALGLNDRIGSIEAGKQADMIVLDASDLHEVAFHGGVNLVSHVIKNGTVVYSEP